MAGFLILWDKPFHSGDWITVGDKYGKVEEITMRTTRLLTWKIIVSALRQERMILFTLRSPYALGCSRCAEGESGHGVDNTGWFSRRS